MKKKVGVDRRLQVYLFGSNIGTDARKNLAEKK